VCRLLAIVLSSDLENRHAVLLVVILHFFKDIHTPIYFTLIIDWRHFASNYIFLKVTSGQLILGLIPFSDSPLVTG
jgi:hypothetical protein